MAMMSKFRQAFHPVAEELDSPPEGDLHPYVAFTQLVAGGPMLYAGWLDAVDDDMALDFGCEHYGRDQACVAVWVIPRPALSGTDVDLPASDKSGSARSYVVFTQAKRGDIHYSASPVTAASPAEAIAQAKSEAKDDPFSIWVAPDDAVVKTGPDDLVWRKSDQTYRLARGYSKEVRRKWEIIRAKSDLEVYERDDLKESF